jgi:ribonuclease J
MESLYSTHEGHTPSENEARKMIEKKFSELADNKNAIFVTTFASHIARIKSIIDFGKKTKRKIIFLGRSMHKYINAAKNVGLWPFENFEIAKYRRQVNAVLKKVEQNPEKYLIVCTGHQAEEGSVLDRIVRGETPFKFKRGDNLVFCSKIIPVALNILAREKMDSILNREGINLHDGLHVSGHSFKEDLKRLIEILRPKHVIPTHGTHEQELPLVRIAQSLGYNFPENITLSKDGKMLKF